MTITTTTVLTDADIERLELAVRGDLISGLGHLARLREGHAHLRAGLSWAAYVQDRFGDLLAQMKMVGDQAGERRELVAGMRLEGMPQRAIADKLGVGLGTITDDLRQLRAAGRLDGEPATVVSGDGITRPARTAPRPPAAVEAPVPTHVQAARAIAKCGAAGGTTREVMRHLRWEQGPASVALSRAARRGLVVATGQRAHATDTSPGFTVYVVAP